MKDNYFILERNGKFMACKKIFKRKYFWSKPVEDFSVLYKGVYKPAHFKTLDKAKKWLKIILKPDIKHSHE